MSFGSYIALVTVAVVFLRWVLFAIYQQEDDGPSFATFMLDPGSHPKDQFRPLISVVFIAAAAVGVVFFW